MRYNMRRAYRNFSKSRTDDNYAKYKDLQKQYIKETNTAYNEYQRNRILNTPHHMLYGELQNSGLIPKKAKTNIAHTPEELNKAFADVSTAPDAPSLEQVFNDIKNSPQDHTELFYFRLITEDEIYKLIKTFTSKATGTDGLSLKLLKITITPIAEFLCNLFNLSLTTGTFPQTWKKSIIVPLNKVPNPQIISEYGPVSLQCCLAKIFEKLVYNQIEIFVNNRNLRDPMQSAHRAHHSWQTALSKLISDAKKAMDNRELTVVLLLDYSKCFDKISRGELALLMHQMGFSLEFIRWLSSYLTDRMQATRGVNEYLTEFLITNMGLPQGSVLITIFFSVYVLLITAIELFCKRIEFSGDRQLYAHCIRQKLAQTINEIIKDIIQELVPDQVHALGFKKN